MKKLSMIFSLVAVAALALVSCKKDDDKTLAQSVEGSYPVNIWVGVGSAQSEPVIDPTQEPIPATIKLSPVGDEVVKLELAGFTFPGMGEIPLSLDNVKIAGTEGSVAMSYTGAITSAALASLNPNGTLTGTVKEGKANADLDLSAADGAILVKVQIKSK